NRGRGGNGQARGAGEGRPERRERPARKPFFAAEGAEGGDRPQRPARPNGDRQQRDNRRNDDFRGQRRGEDAPRLEVDNDLTTTSDFRPAKKQFGSQNGEGRPARTEPRKEHRKGGNGAQNPHAAHGAHELAAQRNNRGPRVEAARPATGGNGGPVKFGNDNRSGQQGRTRRPA
ncbi:Hypothetical protein, partial CDS, partial [Neorhizobium galegae bv. officinalis]